MHIVNIMFSRLGGGIEQAFVDYCEGLKSRGHRVTAVTHPRAVVNAPLRALGIEPISLRNLGEWDALAIWRLRRLLSPLSPDIAIAHTTRSFTLAKYAIGGAFPLVGVAHNYHKRIRRMQSASAVFTTTHDLMQFVAGLGVPSERIYHIPNMVRCQGFPQRGPRRTPPVIGAMGRFVAKKGFDVYIDALKILHQRGYRFSAVLGGAGEEDAALKKQAKAAGLSDVLSFPGWVQDKTEFYTGCDIFCLPSLHEPFGIVLLEAFTHGTPVIATDSEGPRDIITPNFDALLVKTGDAFTLAEAMARLISQPQLATDLAANAFAKAKSCYSLEGVAERIERALEKVIPSPLAGEG